MYFNVTCGFYIMECVLLKTCWNTVKVNVISGIFK